MRLRSPDASTCTVGESDAMTYGRKSFDIVGFTFFADIYCKSCGDKLPEVDPEGNDKHPVFVDNSWEWEDTGTNCGECGLPFGEW